MTVFDTDILIDLESGNKHTIQKLEILAKEYVNPPQITFINLTEFLFGIKIKSEKKQLQALNFIKKFGVLHTTDQTSYLIADLRFKYEKVGINLPLADLTIAALAIENDMVLVTRDKDFEKIHELKKVII